MAFDWGDIINAALAVYGIKQGQKPPKFYQVPPTPQEQWKDDATKNLAGYASQYTDQFMKGLGDMNPDYRLQTNLVGNPSFMGGIHLPHFDFSKAPAPLAAPAATPPPFGGDGQRPDRIGDKNLQGPSLNNGPGTTPGGLAADMPQNFNPADWDKLKGLYQTYGKDAGSFLTAAMGGSIPGMTVAIAKGVWDYFHQQQQLPNKPITDPSLVSQNGTAPTQPTTRQDLNPLTGPQQNGVDFINNQNQGLKDPLGGGGYGGDHSGGTPWFDKIGYGGIKY